MLTQFKVNWANLDLTINLKKVGFVSLENGSFFSRVSQIYSLMALETKLRTIVFLEASKPINLSMLHHSIVKLIKSLAE
jgi:hypothetical protein